MPSSWSIKLAGTCRPASSCPQTSPSLRCRQNAPSSIRSKTSGSFCATTGSRTASSNPTTISSTIAATLGTSSSISPGASCPLDCANGRTGSDQWELVLGRLIRPPEKICRPVDQPTRNNASDRRDIDNPPPILVKAVLEDEHARHQGDRRQPATEPVPEVS